MSTRPSVRYRQTALRDAEIKALDMQRRHLAAPHPATGNAAEAAYTRLLARAQAEILALQVELRANPKTPTRDERGI